jgi:hypothetical protein
MEVPKDNRSWQNGATTEFWNHVCLLQKAYPKCTIHLKWLRITKMGCYGFDVKVGAHNKDLLSALRQAYTIYFQIPLYH